MRCHRRQGTAEAATDVTPVRANRVADTNATGTRSLTRDENGGVGSPVAVTSGEGRYELHGVANKLQQSVS